MKRTSRGFVILATSVMMLVCGCTVCESRPSADPVDYVSTLVGTLSKHSLSTGNTYPAVAMPWGTHFWTPQTGKMGDGWAYVYTEDKIRGFKQTHQPSPWMNDYGQFSLMPVTSGPVWDEDSRASWFSHKAETATPYYYSVYLADHDTFVEISPTERAAAFRITYPQREMSYLVVDAWKGADIKVDGLRITGYVTNNSGGVPDGFRNYFVVESDTPFQSVKTIEGPDGCYALVGFPTEKGQKVNLKVASSFIGPEQAVFNLEELGDGNLDSISDKCRGRWNELLSRIEILDDDIDNLRTFYSCLYRSLLFPRDLSEVTSDGRRVHYSPHDGKVHDGHLFTDTGLWDTFRSLFALLDLVYPETAAKIMEGYVNHYLESGLLPEWASPGHRDCMIGNNSASVVAEAYVKGVPCDGYEVLWEALKAGTHTYDNKVYGASGRKGWEYYDSLGYVPCDKGINESAARTLEYAYNDWCIYTFGKALGKSEEELAPYAEAALNYRNLYREDVSLMAGRKADGTFPESFSPYRWGGDFTEGNAIHYTWSVFHDPEGLSRLMGGHEAMASNLDKVFEMPPVFDDSYYGFTIHEIREMQIMNMGNYAHGNQPVQHMLYLYDWCGQPWKAQMRIREVMDKMYNPLPDGYCGDEDNGQTSAWYVFSALGFYPVCPAGGEYAIGTPLFKKAVVHLPSGKDIKIIAPENSRDNYYIKGMKVDGKKYGRNYLTHEQLTTGPELRFDMSDVPNQSRGTSTDSFPYSYSGITPGMPE